MWDFQPQKIGVNDEEVKKLFHQRSSNKFENIKKYNVSFFKITGKSDWFQRDKSFIDHLHPDVP